jgi:hypothetical protein
MITLPTNDTLVKNLFKSESSIRTGVGCTIEYNLNSMVNFATNAITNSSSEYVSPALPGGVTRYPFRKLFPVDAIVRQNRPLGAGVNYYITEDPTIPELAKEKILDPRTMLFDKQYRTYIPSQDTYYKYWVSKINSGVDIAIKYPKTLLVNKITVKFEISHCTPASWTISGRDGNGNFLPLKTGDSTNIKSFTTTVGSTTNKNYDAGQVNIYYTGSAWSFDESLLNTSAYVPMTDVKLVVSPVSGKYISVIEISPKMVKDISEDIVSFSIKKESSSTGDLLPVGNVSSNSMSLSINGYGESAPTYTIYDKTNGEFEPNKKYFYKNAQLNLFIKVFPYPDNNEYIKVPQGVFFMQDWSVSEFGEIDINALDGCKILMDTMCPDILLKDYSVPAIIRVLLDTVGFTNYKFNTTSLATENSIVTPKYWWTEDVKTVWEAIQELCRDIQMTAVMDDNNVLQFYTRDYFYGEQRETTPQGVAANNIISWAFNNEPFIDLSTNLINQANIIDLNKEALPAANKVKVLWSAATTSNYLGDSTPLWKSETTFLGALALYSNINAESEYGVTADPFNGKYYLLLKPNHVSSYDNTQALLSYSGYLLIDSEVFEYDAIEFIYEGLDGLPYRQDIQTANDIYKYRSLAKVSSSSFVPSYRYRIKSRAALNTKKAAHKGLSADYVSDWKSFGVNW